MSYNKLNECLIEVPIPVDYPDLTDLDINKLCRICLTMKNADADMVSLVSAKENKMGEMFSTITSIQIHTYDGFPNQICTECKKHVEDYYNFRMKCQKSHSILKSILNVEVNEEVQAKLFIHEVKNQDSSTEELKTEDAIFHEEDLHENVEYLDEFVENDNDNEPFLIETIPEVKRSHRNKLRIHVTDSETLLEEVVSDRSKKKNKRKSLTCDVCFKTFHKMKTYKGHMRLHISSASLPHSCAKCKASFTTEHDLKVHTAVHNRGPLWKCNECRKEFTGRAALVRHVKRHMQVKGFACERCGKTFTELYALRRHARVHTGEAQDKRHCCHLCDKRYVSRNKLAEHVARHGGTRPCVCACGKAFADARLLASHRRVHTDRKPHKCEYCDQRFRHESTRNTHHRTHTGEKPYVCATCGKTFIQNSNLRLHMRTHTGEKPYSCDICKRRFASGSTLKNHQIIHSDDKPYSCEICGKRFARRDTLTSHARTHSTPRPFACGACPRAFTAAARLREHSRVHTGEKPYECVMCPQRFASKSHLVKHSKKHFKHAVKKDTKQVEEKLETQEKSENSVKIETVDINKDIHLDIEEMPLEVSQELILEDGDMKAEIMVINENDGYVNGLSLNDVNVVNCDVNLITVKEDELT